ncbi:MAG: hypothetical protein FJ202_03695 [Gemmatimonadetes bacterium]|nr:hypothetical protein [Gemmatimonadota bacterium]
MPGRQRSLRIGTAVGAALAVLVTACDPNAATTGPTGTTNKDFAANLRLVSGDQQTASIGSTLSLPVRAKVVDAGGQPVEGATVTWSVRAGGGSANPAAGISDANGNVSTNWTMGTTLGAAKLVGILANSFVLDSAVFTATTTTGPVASLTRVSGDSQTTNAGRTLGAALVVKAKDAFGNNLSGVKITWTPAVLNGSASFTTDTTAADGTASASWKLGTGATVQSLSAAATGLAAVGFTATATPDTGRVVTITGGDAQTGAVSVALATQITARVTDQYGNLINGETIVWNDSLTGGGSLSPLISATGTNGQTSTTWTLGLRPGPQLARLRTTNGTRKTYSATATIGFSDVRAGNFQTCGIVAGNNRAYCWGLNDVGQLGKGTLISATAPTTPAATATDSTAGPFVQFRQLTSGESLFCGITTSRALYCWGRLITGATSNVASLQAIASGGSQATANLVAVGEEHACHLSLAGQGFCTGVNETGQVGNGTTTSTGANIWASIGAGLYSSLSAGRSHTCGMPRYDGTVASQRPQCWGLNNAGQVGDATTVNKSVPTSITLPVAGAAFDSTSLTAGGSHSCAMLVGGTTAYCWGSNGYGQLGNGAADNIAHSTALAVTAPAGGAVTWRTVVAGEFHTCGLTTAGAAYCWGRNDYGQLGNGLRTNSATPVAVSGGLVFRSISVGELHTCAVAAAIGTPTGPSSSIGTVYCWGDNVYGQLGLGTSGSNNPTLTPARVLYQP